VTIRPAQSASVRYAPGSPFISLGTSGALLTPTNVIAANPERAVHTFCHAIPGMWIHAGAILSAASCLAWISRLLGASEADLLGPLGLSPKAPSTVSFLPYLSGERTPHDDPTARGMLDGLSHGTEAVCTPPRRVETFEPETSLVAAYAERLPEWRKLYRPRR